MFYTPEQIEELKNKPWTIEEYNIQKQIVIDIINDTLTRENKRTYLDIFQKEIFEKENMINKLNDCGWVTKIEETPSINRIKFTFNKKQID